MMDDPKFRALIWILAFELTTIWVGGGCRTEKKVKCNPMVVSTCEP